jgi:GAF domain-containing protein
MPSQEPVDGNRLADQLSRLLVALEASGRAVLPGSQDELLRSIVETAARIFGAAAASIALVNEKEQTLEFKVSVGQGNDNVEGMSIPLDTGIAGYVAMTGQPIAISDVQRDARFNQAFARSTGYVPRSILATPLVSDERIIGVMEVLDKIEAPYFDMQDMELLGLFARQAAIAIHQSQLLEQFGEILILGLKSLAVEDAVADASQILGVLETARAQRALNPEIVALVNFFNKILSMGEAESRVSLQILNALADYWRSRSRLVI